MPRLDLPADENVDLEELEQFAKEFKQRRIKLGKQKTIYHDENINLFSMKSQNIFMISNFVLRLHTRRRWASHG